MKRPPTLAAPRGLASRSGRPFTTDVRLTLAGLRHHPVLLTGAPFPELLARLAPFFDVEVAGHIDPSDREAVRNRLDGKSALLDARRIAIDAALLATLPHLKAICRIGSSHVGLDVDACTRAGVIVTITADLGTDERASLEMSLVAADNLVAAFGFGRHAGHPTNMLNPELRCVLGCCL
jgi:hypothetical protein